MLRIMTRADTEHYGAMKGVCVVAVRELPCVAVL